MAWEDLTERERGYIAGFLDGEGSIVVNFFNNKKYYRLTVSFYNTHKETMDWIAEKLNYVVDCRIVDKRRDELHTKDNYIIQIRRMSDVLLFLKQIKPYLITKKIQAELGIRFLETIMNRETHVYSEEDREFMAKCHEQMSVLNQGGDSYFLG